MIGMLTTTLPSSLDSIESYQPGGCRAVFDDEPLAVLKDPRICRFVPFWLDVLGEIGAQPRIVIPVRSPLDVAESLKLRNGFSSSKSLLLWLRHTLDAEAETRKLSRSI